MKITTEDYQALASALGKVSAVEMPEDHSPMRRRWDLLHRSRFDVCSLYHYLNDDHIDTALRRFMSENPECSICRRRHPSDDRHPCE